MNNKKNILLLLSLLLGCVTVVANSRYRVTSDKKELMIQTDNGTLRLQPIREDAVRVLFGNTTQRTHPEWVYLSGTSVPVFKVKTSVGKAVLTTAKMRVEVDLHDARVTYYDEKGKQVLQEIPGGRVCSPSIIRNEKTWLAEQRFVSPTDEHLYGMGQFQDGYLNIRGLSRRLIQTNSQIALPFVLSSYGYGLMWNNYGMTWFNPCDKQLDLVPLLDTEGKQIGEEYTTSFVVKQKGQYSFWLDHGRTTARKQFITIDGDTLVDHENPWMPGAFGWVTSLEAGSHTLKFIGYDKDNPAVYMRPVTNETVFRSPTSDGIDYTVFVGEADEVIASYRTLTGAAPMLPAWAFGYIHCRERYHTQKELLENATEFRRRAYPLDMIVQDWQYWGDRGWNAMQFDPKLFPTPRQMVDSLHAMKTHLMVSVWSRIDKASQLGKRFDNRQLFVEGTEWVDFYNPAAATLYWDSMRDSLLSLGIDAWWQDATEPENDALCGLQTYAGLGDKLRLTYPLLVCRTVYEGLSRDDAARRPFILSRSAFLGQQRYGAAVWSGDITDTYESMRRQLTAGLGFVSCGQPYWTFDAGGFLRQGNQYKDPLFHRRMLRWFQMATFAPLQRIHGLDSNTEFWRYGEEVEREARRYLSLRYRLFPYIYSNADQVTTNGSTLMRPLVMDFAADHRALDVEDEYMFGRNLLIAPVLSSRDERTVYLPETLSGWFDFWTGKQYAGGQELTVSAPLSTIPVYVRAGSILPLGIDGRYTSSGTPEGPIELRIYRGADASFTLYEDEGDNTNYRQGACSRIHLTWNDRRQALTIGRREGAFEGMPDERVFRIVLVDSLSGTGIEEGLASETVTYNGNPITVNVSSKPLRVKIATAPSTFCNPINIDYRFMVINGGDGIREAADPVVVTYRDKYLLFASKSSGYWYSTDCSNWTHVLIPDSVLPIEDYAPGIFVHNDYVYYVGSTHGKGMLYRSNSPETGRWEAVKEIPSFWDPAFYVEGDLLYLYYGCSPQDPIHVQVLDLHTFEVLSEVFDCLNSDKVNHGWERTGELNELPRRPYIEGAWMTKHGGRYYLQYAGPGTEWKSYADGVYVSDSPIGPFTYMENNPVSYKPTGFIGGAGHGCMFQAGGQYWKAATNAICVRHMFERRVSFFPAGFDQDGYLHTDTYLGDYPMFLPATDEAATATHPNWMLLSAGKPVTVSSALSGYPATNAVDEESRTAWVAAGNSSAEWMQIDLEQKATVCAIQVNYDEYGATQKGINKALCQSYVMYASMDGREWFPIVDKSRKVTDTPHDYIEFEQPFQARYLRWENRAYTVADQVSLRELRIFGQVNGPKPQVVSDFMVQRDPTDPCRATLTWPLVDGADGYIVRYGIAKDKLYTNFQVMDTTQLSIGSLNAGVSYYFVIDTYNAHGISSGKILKKIE